MLWQLVLIALAISPLRADPLPFRRSLQTRYAQVHSRNVYTVIEAALIPALESSSAYPAVAASWDAPPSVSVAEPLLALAPPPPTVIILPQANSLVDPLATLNTGDLLDPYAESASVPPARPLVMAYYPDWAGDAFPPEKIDFARFDWVDFAFATPDQDFHLAWDDPKGSPALLHRLVSVAHKAGKKVKLSIGGWSGSRYFSPAVASEQSRRTFAKNILNTYNTFNVDGIDIDWEYPGQQGEGSNVVSPGDTANFLSFLQLLRGVLPPSAKMSAAVQTQPFSDGHAHPITDAGQFGQVLDWILLMNYDASGSSSTPGPNAPLNEGCQNSTQPQSNAVAAHNAWTRAGFPANKLVLGVPSYAYISRSTAAHLRQRTAIPPRQRKAHVRDDDSQTTDDDTQVPDDDIQVTSDEGSPSSGQVQFRALLAQGAVKRTNQTAPNGAPVFLGADDFARHWDACTSTPWLRSVAARQVVTYDDPESIGLKAAFAKRMGMLGVNMFDVHGDTDEFEMVDAVRRGLGLIR